jgi:AcrR family transcriptional regulator
MIGGPVAGDPSRFRVHPATVKSGSATRESRRTSREDLTPAIERAAAHLFAERGFESTTMQDIAARVGVTAAGLYYYFPSKQILLFEVLKSSLEAVIESVEQAVKVQLDSGEAGPAARLAAFIQSHVRFQIDKVEESAVYGAAFYGSHHMLNALSEEQRGRLRELQHRSFDLLRATLREGVEAGVFRIAELTVTASAIIGMGEYVPAWFRPGGRLTREDLGRLYADIGLRMVDAGSRTGAN